MGDISGVCKNVLFFYSNFVKTIYLYSYQRTKHKTLDDMKEKK